MQFVYVILSILVVRFIYKNLLRKLYKTRYTNIFLMYPDDQKRTFVLTPLLIDRFFHADKVEDDRSDYHFNRMSEIDDEINKIEKESPDQVIARGLNLIKVMVEDHSENVNTHIYSLIYAMPLTKSLFELRKNKR